MYLFPTRRVIIIAPLTAIVIVAITSATPPPSHTQNSAPSAPDSVPEAGDPRYGLLSPLPSTGGIPAIYDKMYGPSDAELAQRARLRDYDKQLRRIKRDYFRGENSKQMREGLEQIREFTDSAAFLPMLEIFEDAPDGVRLAIFDHLQEQGEAGYAALAWAAIHANGKDKNAAAMQHEATLRLSEHLLNGPTPQPVLQVLDSALRSTNHRIANNAGSLAGAIGALETIPLLMFAQATADPAPANEGDLAWIAIQTQQVYVANVQPVVGDDSGAFQPVLGVVSEGTVLRVMDAVVVVYRTGIHDSLVNMTTHDWGRSTEHLAYDMKAWWLWYNTEYVPFKNEQAAMRDLQRQNSTLLPGAPQTVP